jgi:predicted nucleic acid-binding protein
MAGRPAERVGSVKYLLDSVILIDHFNGITPATAFLRRHKEELAISPITRAEVLTGFEQAELARPARLLMTFGFLNIEAATADLAARLRREQHWKLPDAFQAALAIEHDVQLVTRNTKDFDPEKLHYIVVPYRL